jgi:hypothetical protein
MLAFAGSEQHLTTMARLDGWCDEATFADGEQGSPGLPGWQAGYQRRIAEGRSRVSRTPAAHITLVPSPCR